MRHVTAYLFFSLTPVRSQVFFGIRDYLYRLISRFRQLVGR